MRRAYFDRSRYLGDSDFIAIPSHLTEKGYAQQLASTIDSGNASDNAILTKVRARAKIPLTFILSINMVIVSLQR